MKPIKFNSVGGRIYTLMIERGMSRKETANKLMVDYKTLGRWINNENSPNGEMIISICKEFNVSADWLLGLSNTRNERNKNQAKGK